MTSDPSPPSTLHSVSRDREGDDHTLVVELPADPAAQSLVRDRLRRWLDDRSSPDDERDDIVLAVHEAVANAVGHAYPHERGGRFRLVARIVLLSAGTLRRVVAAVRDWGRWKPASRDPHYRALGLTMIEGAMSRLEIRRHEDGTEITMFSAAVVAPLRSARDGSRVLHLRAGPRRF